MKQGFNHTIPIYFKLQDMLECVFANGKTQLIFSISASKKVMEAPSQPSGHRCSSFHINIL